MSRVAGVILMGGQGERLGGADKAALDIGGQTLLARVWSAAAGCEPLLLATGQVVRNDFELPSVKDLAGDYAGPLAGVTAAVDALGGADADFLLSLAVDTPFFPSDFLDRALAMIKEADAVLGAFGDQDYPTNALWRLSALATLPENVRAGASPRSLKRLAQGLRALRLDYAPFTAEDPFANANTPQDLANLRLRATRESAG